MSKTFHWPPPLSSCPHSYWMTPLKKLKFQVQMARALVCLNHWLNLGHIDIFSEAISELQKIGESKTQKFFSPKPQGNGLAFLISTFESKTTHRNEIRFFVLLVSFFIISLDFSTVFVCVYWKLKVSWMGFWCGQIIMHS